MGYWIGFLLIIGWVYFSFFYRKNKSKTNNETINIDQLPKTTVQIDDLDIKPNQERMTIKGKEHYVIKRGEDDFLLVPVDEVEAEQSTPFIKTEFDKDAWDDEYYSYDPSRRKQIDLILEFDFIDANGKKTH